MKKKKKNELGKRKKIGALPESNRWPLRPKLSIIPLDQTPLITLF